MITVLDEQMEALRRNAIDLFEDRLVARLRPTLPEALRDLADDALHARVRAALEEALAAGLRAEAEVAGHVEARLGVPASTPDAGPGRQAVGDPVQRHAGPAR